MDECSMVWDTLQARTSGGGGGAALYGRKSTRLHVRDDAQELLSNGVLVREGGVCA